MDLQNIGIIGFGLLGGSLAAGCKKKVPGCTIWGMDLQKEALEYARQKNFLDHDWPIDQLQNISILELLDIVVLAAPVLQNQKILKMLLGTQGLASLDLTFTDVGSTKNEICQSAWSMDEGYRFIGAHPMAGKERSGVGFANADLYQSATIFLCMPQNQGQARAHVQKTQRFWQSLGGIISEVEPDYHDEIVARTSHLPHLLSMALMVFLGKHPRMHESLFNEQKKWFGGGLIDFTRIAASSPYMWQDIFLQNKKAIIHALKEYRSELNDFLELLQLEDDEKIFDYLSQSAYLRDRMVPPSEKVSRKDALS